MGGVQLGAVRGQVHLVHLFCPRAANTAHAGQCQRAPGRDHLLVGVQSTKVGAKDARILTGAPDHRGPMEVRQQNTAMWWIINNSMYISSIITGIDVIQGILRLN